MHYIFMLLIPGMFSSYFQPVLRRTTPNRVLPARKSMKYILWMSNGYWWSSKRKEISSFGRNNLSHFHHLLDESGQPLNLPLCVLLYLLSLSLNRGHFDLNKFESVDIRWDNSNSHQVILSYISLVVMAENLMALVNQIMRHLEAITFYFDTMQPVMSIYKVQ